MHQPRLRIPSGTQRVSSYLQSNLLGGITIYGPEKSQTSELQQMGLLTIQEVADWAKVITKSIYRWISDNEISAIRLENRTYRIPEKAIIDY